MTLQRKKQTLTWKGHHLVCSSEAGTPLHQSDVHTVWTKATEKAGIARYRPHSLRHTFASALIREGLDSLEVARVLGQTSPALVWKTYGHMAPATRRLAADLLEVAYAGSAAGS